jgi:hypothetical protein
VRGILRGSAQTEWLTPTQSVLLSQRLIADQRPSIRNAATASRVPRGLRFHSADVRQGSALCSRRRVRWIAIRFWTKGDSVEQLVETMANALDKMRAHVRFVIAQQGAGRYAVIVIRIGTLDVARSAQASLTRSQNHV